MNTEALSLLAVGLLVWASIVYLPMAFGLRRGELVWSGRYPRLLPSELRWRSFIHAMFLLLSAWVLAAFANLVDIAPVSDHWQRSAGWVVMVFLGVTTVYSFIWGSRWERMLMGPITLFGAILAWWFTFG